MDTPTFWHLQPGNHEKQVYGVMTAVKDLLAGKTKRLQVSSQGFDTDYDSALAFVTLITDELQKLGLEGDHDLHQSTSGSGKWYYHLKGVWPRHNTGLFTSFSVASAYARKHQGTLVPIGDKQWKVTL